MKDNKIGVVGGLVDTNSAQTNCTIPLGVLKKKKSIAL